MFITTWRRSHKSLIHSPLLAEWQPTGTGWQLSLGCLLSTLTCWQQAGAARWISTSVRSVLWTMAGLGIVRSHSLCQANFERKSKLDFIWLNRLANQHLFLGERKGECFYNIIIICQLVLKQSDFHQFERHLWWVLGSCCRLQAPLPRQPLKQLTQLSGGWMQPLTLSLSFPWNAHGLAVGTSTSFKDIGPCIHPGLISLQSCSYTSWMWGHWMKLVSSLIQSKYDGRQTWGWKCIWLGKLSMPEWCTVLAVLVLLPVALLFPAVKHG